MLLATGAIRWLTFTSRALCRGLLQMAISSKGGWVSTAIIANDLGLNEVTVKTLQRMMGLRRCKIVPREGDRED